MKAIEIKTLSQEKFSNYGTIIELKRNDGSGRYFEVLVEAKSNGWRIGVMDVQRYVVPYLERHLKSKESHEPVCGTMILLVAPAEKPENIEAFLLDKPVSVDEGVWHQIMAISDTARVKVTENLDMPSNESETWKLPGNLISNIINIE